MALAPTPEATPLVHSSWLRARLRQWLGITNCEARLVLLQGSVDGVQAMTRDLAQKHTELNAMLQNVRELKETLANPKSVPIRTNMPEYRRLMQEEKV